MSQEKQPEKEAVKADGAQEQSEELNEEQLESVAGGVLIGLNVASVAHKDSVASLSDGLDFKVPVTTGITDATFKFKK